MTDHVAFLRGINVGGNGLITMDDLRKAFEALGFGDVKTLGASGNVSFTSAGADPRAAAKTIAAGMKERFGREIAVHVRRREDLKKMVAADPFKAVKPVAGEKRIVTFLDGPPKTPLALPYEKDGARIIAVKDGTAFSAHVRSPKGAVFMSVLEKAFGKNVTTRTWDVVRKLAGAAADARPKNAAGWKTCSRGHKYRGSRCGTCWPGGMKRKRP